MIKNWKIDHITMAVDDNKVATERFTDIFGANFLKEIAMVSLGAQAYYVNIGETVFGLESPTKENSDIGKFLKKRGEGIHHICFSVDNIQEVEHDFREKGLTLIGPEVHEGIKTDLFIHPKSCFGVLVQITEWKEPYRSSFDERAKILAENN